MHCATNAHVWSFVVVSRIPPTLRKYLRMALGIVEVYMDLTVFPIAFCSMLICLEPAKREQCLMLLALSSKARRGQNSGCFMQFIVI